jgi:beta-galactosidase/beta-glucuronidase
VASVSANAIGAGGTTVTFDQTTRAIANPKLWHPDHPFLYTAVSKVSTASRNTDQFSNAVWFPLVQVDGGPGIFPERRAFYFKGANVHQDHAGWGDAVADSGFYRDVQLVKDAGFDFIRGSHYPHAPAFAAACDQLGVLFWSENCFWGMGGPGAGWLWNASAYPINSGGRRGV